MNFNKPHLVGRELNYIEDAVLGSHISGNGKYTKLCHQFFKDNYGFSNCLLTTSCTDALEMAAILIDIQPGDEVIMPSYTFVSTANAFVLRGAVVKFCDSRKDHPGIDEIQIESLITEKTKAIIVVHYAGFATDMDIVMDISEKHNLFVIEDAAQAIDNYYIDSKSEKIPLGSIGHFGTFSFHETKNIIAGEGGLLVINDDKFAERAEILWEKGTNRSAFFRGEVNKYGWVDVGSSFLPSDIIAAFLYAQLESLSDIQKKRISIWEYYYHGLKDLEKKGLLKLPTPLGFSTNNAHMFYMLCNSLEERSALIKYLKENEINAVFHYQSLHKSEYYKELHGNRVLKNSDEYTDRLLRLPMYYALKPEDLEKVVGTIKKFFNS